MRQTSSVRQVAPPEVLRADVVAEVLGLALEVARRARALGDLAELLLRCYMIVVVFVVGCLCYVTV